MARKNPKRQLRIRKPKDATDDLASLKKKVEQDQCKAFQNLLKKLSDS